MAEKQAGRKWTTGMPLSLQLVPGSLYAFISFNLHNHCVRQSLLLPSSCTGGNRNFRYCFSWFLLLYQIIIDQVGYKYVRDIYVSVWRLRSSRSRCWQIWCLVRTCFWFIDDVFMLCPHMASPFPGASGSRPPEFWQLFEGHRSHLRGLCFLDLSTSPSATSQPLPGD